MTIGLRIGATTDVGAQRDVNQDSYATAARIAVVADGMGGHRGGEVASALAASEMVARFDPPELAVLVAGVTGANQRIIETAAADTRLLGMGTTVVALAVVDTPTTPDTPGGRALAAINVGDSRLYRLTGNTLEQLTEDHSLVGSLLREKRITPEQAATHPQRNVVTRALGVFDEVEVDDFRFVPNYGDRYLLCSDGLFNEVADQAIAELLAGHETPQAAAEALVAAANRGGGRDNITTIVVDIVDEADAEVPGDTMVLASTIAALETDGPQLSADADGAAGAGTFDRPQPARPARSWLRWRRS